jgi:hypothetical protein
MESIVEEEVQLEQEAKETFSSWVECDSCRVARAVWNRSEAALTKWAISFVELDQKLT